MAEPAADVQAEAQYTDTNLDQQASSFPDPSSQYGSTEAPQQPMPAGGSITPPPPPPSPVGQVPQAMSEDPGKTLGVVGIVLAFVASLVGLILSIISLIRSRKANHKGTLGLVGIILNSVMIVISIAIAIAFVTSFYSSLDERIEKVSEKDSSSKVSKDDKDAKGSKDDKDVESAIDEIVPDEGDEGSAGYGNLSAEIENVDDYKNYPSQNGSVAANDEVLFNDALRIVYTSEVARGATGSISVKSATSYIIRQDLLVEEWEVDTGGKLSRYRITMKFIDGGNGGTDISARWLSDGS